MRHMLPFRGLLVCLSVCNVRALRSNGRRYWHDLCCPMSLLHWLTSVNPFLPKFWPKVTHLCWFELWRHSMANWYWMVRDSTVLTMESLWETTIAFSYGAIASTTTPSPKMGVLKHTNDVTPLQSTLALVDFLVAEDEKMGWLLLILLFFCNLMQSLFPDQLF